MFGTRNFVVYAALTLCVINDGSAYKIPHGTPVPVLKNAPYVYRGQVFILRETDDQKSPFVAEIVNGGIEMVLQMPRPIPVPPPAAASGHSRINESLPEVQEDPEYFAVLVTPETVALSQISRSMIIEVPLVMLLTGITKRMPWVMVLKRKNHFDYFRSIEPTLTPMQVITPLRRRSRSFNHRSARLVTDSHKYDMVYSQEDKIMLENICTSVIQELAFFSTLLHQYNNNTEPYDADQFGFLDEMNETNPNPEKKNETTKVEYVLPIAGDKVEKYSATKLQNRTQQVAAN